LENPNGRIILKRMLEKYERGMDWIDLVQNRDRWQALVNAVMNRPGSITCGKFLE
jgi:hypothetical protein